MPTEDTIRYGSGCMSKCRDVKLGGMSMLKEIDAMDEILRKANKIVTDCNKYMAERIAEEEIDQLSGIEQVERILAFEAEYYLVHDSEYLLLREYEDMLFFEAKQEENYLEHLRCVQECRRFLIHALRKGMEDKTIHGVLEPQQEAAVLAGSFGSVLRSECEKIQKQGKISQQEITKKRCDCIEMSTRYLRSNEKTAKISKVIRKRQEE